MAQASPPKLLRDVIESAVTLTENLCPVVFLQPGLKKPLTDDSHTWLTFDDPDVVANAIERRYAEARRIPNLGVLLHPKETSPLICVDVDGSDPRVTEKLQSLGVSRGEENWRQVTGKRNGHFHIFYLWKGDPLPRVTTRPDGLPVDLLSNGYAVVSPSNTCLEPGGGGPYRWVEGHGPTDITLAELEPPPDPLVTWWLERAIGPMHSAIGFTRHSEKTKAWVFLNQPIGQGQRNEILTRIGGWIRLYHPPPVVEAFLLVVNDARCEPPLPKGEVVAIARSVCKYPQPGVNGHPRAVVPMFYRAEDSDDPIQHPQRGVHIPG